MSYVVEGEARIAFTNTPGAVPQPPDNGELKVHQADGYLISRRADGTARKTPLDLGTAALLSTTALSSPNLWFNPDCALGNGVAQLLPNTALNVFGPDGWTFQQTGLNPFETVSRVTMPEGDTAIFWMNGIFAAGDNSFSTGVKTLTTDLANINFVGGFDVEMVDRDDISKKMFCTVTSYVGKTLVLQANSISGGATGNRFNWVVGRNGNTSKGRTTLITTAPTPPGSDTLHFADTSAFEKGATIEFAYDANFYSLAGIQLGAYIVDKTPTTVKMSLPAVSPAGAPLGVAVVAGQPITTYGNQGHYGYQDLSISDIGSLRYGTALARDSAFDFDVVSNVGGLRASVMFLGYKPTAPFIGRALTQSFPITTERKRITLTIPGDTEHPDDTWIGEGLDGSWGTLGFALDSKGTPTSQNIPDGIWKTAPGPGFGIGGSDQQTFQLGDMVGAWVKITRVKWSLDHTSSYEAPTTLQGRYPTPYVRLRDRKLPRLFWECTTAPFNKKKWQAYAKANGILTFGKLTDAEDGEIAALALNPDGSVTMPQYPAGDMVVLAGGVLGSVPKTFTPYDPVPTSTGGAATFTGSTAGVRTKNGEAEIELNIKTPTVTVPTPDNGASFIVASLPPGLPADATGATFVGYDSGFFGETVFGWITPGGSSIQLFRLGTKTDGTFGKVYPARAGSNIVMLGKYRTA